MLNLKCFEDYNDENNYIHINVHNKINESTQFGENLFKKIINFSNQNVLIIGCPDFIKELKSQKTIECIHFDDDFKEYYTYVSMDLLKDFDDKKISKKVTSSIVKKLKGKVFDKIFNFSIVTDSVTNYEIVAKFNAWLFETYFIPGITSWYSFDEPDVQQQFEANISIKKKEKTGYRVKTVGVFDKNTWKEYGFTDGSERILTQVIADKTDTYKTAMEMDDEENSSSVEKIDTGKYLHGVIEPSIYAFRSKKVNGYIGGEDDRNGAMKVGDTSRDVKVRMSEWAKVFDDLEPVKSYSAVVRGVDDNLDGRVFRDYTIHKILKAGGHENLKRTDFPDPDKYSNEFFRGVVINDKQDDVQSAIDLFYDGLKDHRSHLIAELKNKEFKESKYVKPEHKKPLPYTERELQTKTINNFKEQALKDNKEMLMYAVMRFGKTYTACRCAQELPNNRFTVVVSAKADVKDEWVNQVNPYKEFENYDMYTVRDEGSLMGNLKNIDDDKTYETLNDYLEAYPDKHIMLFITLQNLDGYTRDKKKDDIKKYFDFFKDTPINLLIIDEAHYGAQGGKYGLGIQEGDTLDEEGKLNAKAEELIKNSLNLEGTTKLHLSGTPYDLIARGKFSKESTISHFGFEDLLEAKKEWNDTYKDFIAEKKPVDRTLNDNVTPDPLNGKVLTWEDNPYFGIPEMRVFGYNFDDFKLKNVIGEGTVSCTSLFRLSDKSYKSNPKIKKFLYEDDILKMFKDIDGTEHEKNILPLLNLPAIKKGNMCKHIVIVLPHRNICDSMEEFLNDKKNKKILKKLGKYRVVNIAGDEHGMSTFAAKEEIRILDESGNKTISLTVKQMLTGVSVKEWDTMFYLKDGESPQEFDQARFRIQTPYIKKLPIYEISDDLQNINIVKDENGDDEIVKIDMKPETIFVDFAISRTYSIMYERAQAQVDSETENNEDNSDDEEDSESSEDTSYQSKIREKIRQELACIPILAYNGDKLEPIEYENAYKKALEIHDAKMFKQCGGNYLEYLEGTTNWGELFEACKGIDLSDFKDGDYKGSGKSSGKVSGSYKKPGGKGSTPADPGSRAPLPPSSSTVEIDKEEDDDLDSMDVKKFANACQTMVRNILIYIICRNDDTQIGTLNRLCDTLRTDESVKRYQNWHVALNIFDPKHSAETDEEKVRKYVIRIKKKIKKLVKILRRIPSVSEKYDKIIFRAADDYKDRRKTHEGIKDSLQQLGKNALGKFEFMFKNDDIIKKMFDNVVIFNNSKILDCYGSKIGEISHYLDSNYKDFDLSNYYLICRTGMIAELNKVTLKIIMRKQGLDFYYENGHKKHMTQIMLEHWLNDHILIYNTDKAVVENNDTDDEIDDINDENTIESNIEEVENEITNQNEKLETFEEFMQMIREGKYVEDKSVRELNKMKRAFESTGGIWKLKNAIEEKWPDMKFDVIVGNPPYNKSLHLQIISTMIPFMSNDGVGSFIHPARWFEDPLSDSKDKITSKKKFNNLLNKIESYLMINSNSANKILNTEFDFDLMISYLNNSNTFEIKNPLNDIVYKSINSILKYSEDNNIFTHIEDYKLDGYRVDVKEIVPQQAKYWNSNAISYKKLPVNIVYGPYLDGYDIFTGLKWTEKPGPKMNFDKGMSHSIKFDTEQEASNFKNSCECNFYKNIIYMLKFDQHMPLKFLPWMEDYSHPWTDEDYCEFFGKLGMSEECQKWMCRKVDDYRVKDFIDYIHFDTNSEEESEPVSPKPVHKSEPVKSKPKNKYEGLTDEEIMNMDKLERERKMDDEDFKMFHEDE